MKIIQDPIIDEIRVARKNENKLKEEFEKMEKDFLVQEAKELSLT